MENEHNNMHGQCNCGGWGHHSRHWGFFVARFVLGLIVLMMVFGLGLKIGELKGYIRASDGYGSMGGQGMFTKKILMDGNGDVMYYRGMGGAPMVPGQMMNQETPDRMQQDVFPPTTNTK